MTLIELCNKRWAPVVGDAIRPVRAEVASMEAGNGVHTFWRPGFIGNDGQNGCRAAILEVLREAGTGLTTRQIVRAARAKGLVNKYPLATFKVSLTIQREAGEVLPVAVSRNGERGRPGFVWVLGPASEKAK